MKKILKVKQKFLRKTLSFLGVCITSLAVSCAKYGIDIIPVNVNLKGFTKAKDTDSSIKSIKVEASGYTNSTVNTGSEGEFSLDLEVDKNYPVVHFKFEDIDGIENGSFETLDTLIDLSIDEINTGRKSDIEIKLKRDE